MNAVAGAGPRRSTSSRSASRTCGAGCWDIDARIADMDINGVWASLNFPSLITGFSRPGVLPGVGPGAGPGRDPGLERLALRGVVAALSRPDHPAAASRSCPTRRVGAAEIRRNAARGFRSVTLPERPHRIGLPASSRGYWDPIVARLRRDRDGHLASTSARRAWPTCPTTPHGGAGGDAVRPDVALRLRRVGVVGTARALPRPQDRHERGRHRLGGDAARPARQHRRPLGLRADFDASGPPAGRGAPAELLVLHHRRPVDHRHPPPDRDRPHHGGGRLPARRLAPGPTPRRSSSGTGATSPSRTCAS